MIATSSWADILLEKMTPTTHPASRHVPFWVELQCQDAPKCRFSLFLLMHSYVTLDLSPYARRGTLANLSFDPQLNMAQGSRRFGRLRACLVLNRKCGFLGSENRNHWPKESVHAHATEGGGGRAPDFRLISHILAGYAPSARPLHSGRVAAVQTSSKAYAICDTGLPVAARRVREIRPATCPPAAPPPHGTNRYMLAIASEDWETVRHRSRL